MAWAFVHRPHWDELGLFQWEARCQAPRVGEDDKLLSWAGRGPLGSPGGGTGRPDPQGLPRAPDSVLLGRPAWGGFQEQPLLRPSSQHPGAKPRPEVSTGGSGVRVQEQGVHDGDSQLVCPVQALDYPWASSP